MKLRIQDNSIRLRLTREEVAALAADGRVERALRFGPAPAQQLVYLLQAVPRCEDLAVQYRPGRVAVHVPAAWAEGWPDDERVGFEGACPTAGGETVRVLIEKDFKCLHRDPAKQTPGAYPHPEAVG